MMITKRGFLCLAAGLLAASLFAGHHHRPFPHGTPPNARWCEKCDGDGYYRTWYFGKRMCGFCGGRGYIVPPPPPPAPHMHKGGVHHGGPAVAPKPAPKPVPPPKGGPRR
jgi:hypothetical protein